MKRVIKKAAKVNKAIAMRATLLIGSMACVYAFLIWSLLPTFFPKLETLVFYVSGGVIQLVLLPLIMVGGSVLNEKSERRAEADHKMLMEELKELRAMHADLHTLIAELKS